MNLLRIFSRVVLDKFGDLLIAKQIGAKHV